MVKTTGHYKKKCFEMLPRHGSSVGRVPFKRFWVGATLRGSNPCCSMRSLEKLKIISLAIYVAKIEINSQIENVAKMFEMLV